MAINITSGIIIKAMWLVVVAAAVIEAAAPPTITCGTVTSTLAPCFEYVLSGGKVTPNCCSGVKSLYKAARTTADRRSVCSCLKSVTSTAPPTAISNAKTLPGKCGVNLPYEISPAIDCNKVK